MAKAKLFSLLGGEQWKIARATGLSDGDVVSICSEMSELKKLKAQVGRGDPKRSR